MSGSRATAATTTPRTADPAAARRGASAPASLAVAYSGGRDSTALLHATLVAARAAQLQVHALHVHHGLSPHADAWAAHCAAQCARWARRGLPVQFHVEQLRLRPARGESVEAVARRARYAALGRMARAAGCALVLLAHHRRDQAETLLLQALRGAGVAGLAGMPASVERDGLTWARPWLAQPHAAIDAYVRRHRLRHIEDDSNADVRFARNRLRLEVWPALSAAFPQAEQALADAATWAQQAHAGLADLAALDLAGCVASDQLDLAAWQQLAPHRAGNALRAWLRDRGLAAGASDIARLLRELPGRGPASWRIGGAQLRRYRGRLSVEQAGGAAAPAAPRLGTQALSLHRAGHYPLPEWGGTLVLERVARAGVAAPRLAALELRPRQGGERFQAGPGRPPRALKKQFQAAALPAWLRRGPLLWSGGELLFVPGLGIDARALAAPGEPQFAIAWQPLAPR